MSAALRSKALKHVSLVVQTPKCSLPQLHTLRLPGHCVSGKGDEATVKSLTLCPKNTLLSGARDLATARPSFK